MPEALATTKRKFHRLLDSRFGSPAAPIPARPTSQGSTTTIAEPATKRIRSDASSASLASKALANKPATAASAVSINRTNSSVRDTTPTRGLGSVRNTSPSHSLASARKLAPTPVREPNFAPWSHDAFIKRLKSFGPVSSWHPKPDSVGEVEWAKRGWWCVDVNTVGCRGGCGCRVVVDVEPIVPRRGEGGEEQEEEDMEDDEDTTAELERALVDKYKDLIVEGHSEECLWRKAGCKEDIYRLPIVKTSVWQPELRARYLSLLAIAPSLADLTLQPTDLHPSPQKILDNLPSSLLDSTNDKDKDEPDGETPVSQETKCKAMTMSLCGWHGSNESRTQLLSCHACFQRIGLWMYQPSYTPHRFDDDDDEPQDRTLDLLALHRDHCPWRNPTTQSATGNYSGKSAHAILLDVLDRYIDEQRRRSRGTVQGPVGNEVQSVDVDADERESLSLETLKSMPDLSREETEKMDTERLSKLRRLKQVLGFKRKGAKV